jgi:hypothetical protein
MAKKRKTQFFAIKENVEMQIRKSAKIFFSVLLILSIAVSIVLPTMAQVYPPAGTHIPTYAFVNVYPNPAGIGQTVTVNFFLSTPPENGAQGGVPTNMSVLVTYPDGTTKSLGNGNFTGDQTGGTFTTFTPDKVGNYTFKFVYGGQTLGGARTSTNYAALILDPSESKPVTLTVQEEPLVETSWPVTPLPTEYWQTPVSAEKRAGMVQDHGSLAWIRCKHICTDRCIQLYKLH